MYHFVFEAEGKDFEISSYLDLLEGFAYDKISGTSFKYDRRALEPDGRYVKLIDSVDILL
jgi:hypothetical protein